MTENSITVHVRPDATGAALLRKIASVIESGGIQKPAAKAEDDEAPKPAKRGRPPKAKEPEVEDDDVEETEVEEADDENNAEEPELEDDGLGDDEPEEKPAKKASKGLTLDAVTKAFQAFAKENGRAKALKVLEKFKVKAVRDIPEAKWPVAVKMLQA